MRYHVTYRDQKDAEFDKYIQVLRRVGMEPTPDNDGRTGVVDDRASAERILEELRKDLPHLKFEIVEIEEQINLVSIRRVQSPKLAYPKDATSFLTDIRPANDDGI